LDHFNAWVFNNIFKLATADYQRQRGGEWHAGATIGEHRSGGGAIGVAASKLAGMTHARAHGKSSKVWFIEHRGAPALMLAKSGRSMR